MEKSGTRVRIRSQLNISLESEHLNPEEIKAHEADTLPIKVDKGYILGVAQSLGTEYFPAACDRRINLLSCFAER